jgi:protein-S-isoprenylcysteine O-methyltransferase Ste14
MTIFGIGPKLVAWTLAYSTIPALRTKAYPDIFVITSMPPAVFNFLGVVLLALGIPLWLLSIFPLLTGFTQGKLCTTGIYSVVRNPMYSAFIVFIVPAITLFFRSWILFTIPIVMYLVFKKLIKAEELYLEEQFGEEYLRYKSEVNALIPIFKSFKFS